MIWAATQGPEVGTPFPQIFISTFPQYGILVYMSLSVLLKLKYDIDLKEKVGGSDWVGCVIFTAGFLAWAFVVHKHLQTKVFAQVNPRRAIGSYRSPRAPLTLRAPLRRSSSPARSERSRRSTARARRRGSRLCVDDSLYSEALRMHTRHTGGGMPSPLPSPPPAAVRACGGVIHVASPAPRAAAAATRSYRYRAAASIGTHTPYSSRGTARSHTASLRRAQHPIKYGNCELGWPCEEARNFVHLTG